MKKNSLLLLLTGWLTCSGINAQQPDEKLNKWSASIPIEKIYIHCDRDEYIAGQTVWFKTYLYSEFLPNDKVSVVFVELINTSSAIISRQTLPVALAVSRGQFELPDTLSAGKYIIRAYTATMLNQDPDFVYKKSITISGKEKKNATPVASGKKIRMEFFPEGGNFVSGMANTIAFKATNEEGWPVEVEGVLKNSKEETIAEFTSYHDGMGMLDLTPADKETYYVSLKNDPSGQKYLLPETVSKGIVFRLLNINDGIQFEIFQPKNDPVFQAAYMIGQIQHNVVFKQPLKQAVATLSGVIKTSNLTSGILHITVFNKDGLPLAERLSFIDNKEYILPAQLITDTINLSARGKNHFTLAFTDTVVGSFSVSVTDPAFAATGMRENNIVSSLLLSADLKGYIHNPGWYFSSANDSMKYALDMVMMTNGWRRFKWNQLISDPLPAARYKDPKFINLSGRVTLEGTKKPFANMDMLLFILGEDSSRNMQIIKTDANGYFDADSVLFFGKSRVLFSDIKGKKSRFVDITPGADSLNRSYRLPLYSGNDLFFLQRSTGEDHSKKLASEYEAYIKGNGVVLSEVVIKSKKKTPLEELEEKYATGAFSGETRKTFDLLNNKEEIGAQNIFEFLEARVQGLRIGRNEDDAEIKIFYRQSTTMNASGNQPMDIFLDEVLTDATSVAFIPVNQIAMVKVYSTFVGSTGNGAGGALAIYMKKGADYFSSLPSAGEIIPYSGFSIIKEFYSPDYSIPAVQNKATPDERITLAWNPDIYVRGINTKIPITFYNNDRTKSFKVVVEGMTRDGKLLMMEKIIAGKGF
jgi:hypothetical protein